MSTNLLTCRYSLDMDLTQIKKLAAQGLSQTAVAREMGVSRQRIHQIANEHKIEFVSAKPVGHGHPGVKYQAGCEVCQEKNRLHQQQYREKNREYDNARKRERQRAARAAAREAAKKLS